MVKLLFQNAKVLICLNDNITKALEIERGIRQGCPLAPLTIYHCWKGPKLHHVRGSKIVGNQSHHSINMSITTTLVTICKRHNNSVIRDEENLWDVYNLLKLFLPIGGLEII
jgi:hypothetical protein